MTIYDKPNINNSIGGANMPDVTKARNATQTVFLIALSIVAGWMLFTVPLWSAFGDPFLLGAVASALTAACLWLTRRMGSRAMRFERAWLAAFLVGMPVVYLLGWLGARNRTAASWSWVELLGLALFAALAVLGLKNSPWFLVIGIAGHGIAWDSWHYKNSAYVPDWYSVACLLVDLALGAYVAARIPACASRVSPKN